MGRTAAETNGDAHRATGEARPARRRLPTPAEVREGAMEGALVVAGEVGFREMSVRTILEHSGGHRAQFYEHFEGKEDCFAQAYAAWIERAGVELLAAALGEASWEDRVRAALLRLFRFVNERPAIARSLFVEVHIAGEPAMARHEAEMERLAAALDSVRDEIPAAESPPEATAAFVVGGVENCVSEALAAGDPGRIWDTLPELMHFAVGSYRGREAAEAAHERASTLLARERERLIGGQA